MRSASGPNASPFAVRSLGYSSWTVASAQVAHVASAALRPVERRERRAWSGDRAPRNESGITPGACNGACSPAEIEQAGVVEPVTHRLDEVRVGRHLGHRRRRRWRTGRRSSATPSRRSVRPSASAQRRQLVAGEVHHDVGVAVLHVDRLRRARRCCGTRCGRTSPGSDRRRRRCGRPPSRSVVLKLSSTYGPGPGRRRVQELLGGVGGVGAGLVGAAVRDRRRRC